MVFHSAYTFDDLKERGLEIFMTSRDAGEFFEEVLTVSPVASLQYPNDDVRILGRPEFMRMDERNLILEGKIGRFNVLRKFKILNFAFAQFSLLYVLVKEGRLRDVKLVRAEDPGFNGVYGYIFSLLLRRPFVVGVWGNPAEIRSFKKTPLAPQLFPSIRMEELVEKFILNRASMVLAQNLDNIGFALSLGVKPEKTCILPLGIGIDKAHFLTNDERLDISTDFRKLGATADYVIVCISRLESLKLVDHAIHACKVLKESQIDFRLLLIGDGREKSNLKKLAIGLDLEKEVIFVGNRGQDWIAAALAKTQLLIAPLTGRALLETALSGCPVVAYDVDWHSEIVKSGITGELVENLNYQKLGEAALRLLRDNPTRIEMGKNMHELALTIADPKVITGKQFDMYRRLVNKNNS